MAGNDVIRRRGVSLVKGPVAIIGVIGVVYGISALILGGHGFALHIPHGAVHGKRWLRLEVNGWSDLLFIAAGALLLFSAPLHWSAKTMSLLVGLALGAAAVIAFIRRDGVFGIFAANHVTELVWAVGAAVLLFLALLPRVGGGRTEVIRDDPAYARDDPAYTRDDAARTGRTRRTRGEDTDADRGDEPADRPRRRIVRRQTADDAATDPERDPEPSASAPDDPDNR